MRHPSLTWAVRMCLIVILGLSDFVLDILIILVTRWPTLYGSLRNGVGVCRLSHPVRRAGCTAHMWATYMYMLSRGDALFFWLNLSHGCTNYTPETPKLWLVKNPRRMEETLKRKELVTG